MTMRETTSVVLKTTSVVLTMRGSMNRCSSTTATLTLRIAMELCRSSSRSLFRNSSAHSERQYTMQQLPVWDAVGSRRGGEFLAFRDLGIGIGFQEIRDAVGREPEVDAGIAVEFQRAIDSLGQLLDAGGEFRGQILGLSVQDVAALLVAGIVLGLLGRDEPVAFRHVAEFQLPHRQRPQPVIAEHADIELAPLDIFLSDGGGADPLMDEGDAVGKFLVA